MYNDLTGLRALFCKEIFRQFQEGHKIPPKLFWALIMKIMREYDQLNKSMLILITFHCGEDWHLKG